MAGFDIARARAEGRTDDEIYDYLIKSRPKFDAQQALTEGRTKQEIIDYLSSTSAPQTGTTAGTGKTGGRLKGETKPSGFFAPMVEGEKQIEQGVGKVGTGVDPTIGGLSDIFRGGLQMAYPYAAALGLSSVPAAVGAVTAIPAGMAGQYGSKALGVPEGTSQAIGDVTGILGGFLGSKLPGLLPEIKVSDAVTKLLPTKYKLPMKIYNYVVDQSKPKPPAGDYLKHGKEPEPGQWGVGMGVSPKEGMNPPPEWLKNLQSFKFEDMERKQRSQSRAPDMPPPPTDPFNTKRVGGFGTSKVPKQSPKISEMLNPEEVEPTLVDQLPEKMGPPVEPPTTNPFPFDTKKVGGFGNSKVPKQNVTPTVRDMTPPPDVELVDLPPEKGGSPPVKPAGKPESVDISQAEREAAPPPVSDAPPTFGTPEWLEQFQKLYPGLPVPEGAAPKPPAPPPPTKPKAPEVKTEGALPGAVTEEDVAAQLAKGKAKEAAAAEKPNPMAAEPAAASDKPAGAAQPKSMADRTADLTPRYQQMAEQYGEQAARDAYNKDTAIARHLIEKKITPEQWDELPFDGTPEKPGKQQYAKTGHGKPKSPGLKQSGGRSRPEAMSIADVRQRLVDLMETGKGMPEMPKEAPKAAAPPAPKAEPAKPAAKEPEKPQGPPKVDQHDADVARWLVDAREMSPEQWEKLTPEEKGAYIQLAGKKMPSDRAPDAVHTGIGQVLKILWGKK